MYATLEFGYMHIFCFPRLISCRDLLYNTVSMVNKPVWSTAKYYSFVHCMLRQEKLG